MDHQLRALLFLVFIQSGWWLAINAEREPHFSPSRFRDMDPSSGSLFTCLQTHCVNHRANPDLYDRCIRSHCLSTRRLTRSPDYHLSVVPWSFQRSPLVICPYSSMAENELLRYCTADACYSITPAGRADETAFDRVEQLVDGRCSRICSDLEGQSYEDCVIRDCCYAYETMPDQDLSSQQMSRKRRVNDDVSQCIQSYCSGYSVFRERILCIVKNCNRSVLTS